MIEKISNVGLDYGIEMLRSNINSDAEALEDNVKPPICGLFVDCGESAALLPRRCLVLHPLLSQVGLPCGRVGFRRHFWQCLWYRYFLGGEVHHMKQDVIVG